MLTLLSTRNCKLFYTYNKTDFKRIREHTRLKIKIL